MGVEKKHDHKQKTAARKQLRIKICVRDKTHADLETVRAGWRDGNSRRIERERMTVGTIMFTKSSRRLVTVFRNRK